MNRIAQLLFEARSLKRLPRSGYQFLGSGNESVAEHSFATTFIAFVLGQMAPEVDTRKLMAMSLVHDLPEARIGDLNYVQKLYVEAHEDAAVNDLVHGLPFGDELKALIDEFNRVDSPEARLAHDADQLAFLIDLKDLADLGYAAPSGWISHVRQRLQTDLGRSLADAILRTPQDRWWRQKFIDSSDQTK
ncbi:MAG: HD domain-containing protein [Desulfobacterales bacterium]|jgi:putative hydrolase of HD superfamily